MCSYLGEGVCVCMCVCSYCTMWQSYAGSIHYGLRQFQVIALCSQSCCSKCIPDLFPPIKGWSRIPEFIPLTPQLALRHGVFALPFRTFLLEWLVSSCEEKQGAVHSGSESD